MTLKLLNESGEERIKNELKNCCGAQKWVTDMASRFPFSDSKMLYEKAEEVWKNCSEKDWLEAFEHHPKIGDLKSLEKKFASTKEWAGGEQAGVNTASRKIIEQLAEKNADYERKFGYIFIVCATGKSAVEMLQILNSRLPNKPEDEIKIAAAEQAKITKIRLQKLLK